MSKNTFPISAVYPGRIPMEHAAFLLGFHAHDMPVLVARKMLRPLGKPVANATKYFALSQIKEHAEDVEWLNRATQILYDYWRGKNDKKKAAVLPDELVKQKPEMTLTE